MISKSRFPDVTSQVQGAGDAYLDLAPGGGFAPASYAAGQQGEALSVMNAPRILIVEDVLMVAWHLESLVQELNFEVCALAADGEEAIEFADDFKPNLLLMDINLGEGMDGIEAARRICEKIDAAVVFVTAYSDAANIDRIKQNFPDALMLAKPVTRETLGAAIKAARKTRLV